MFNSLKYAKQLEGVGLPREQAEAHVQIMTEIVETSLATKQDLKDLKTDLESRMIQLEYRLTIKLGTIVSLAIGIAVTLSKFVAD